MNRITVPDYIIKGNIKDGNGNAIKDVKIQAMDSDQQWFEDRNDDVIGSVWVNADGTFEIHFDEEQFKDGWLEGNPDIYLIIRNSLGENIYTTEIRRGVEPSDTKNLTFNITLDSLEKKAESSDNPYAQNNDRVMAAFARLGEVTDLNAGDAARIFRLLTSAVNAWSLYTREHMWKAIGYDGPQVPRYPWKEQHPHKLEWGERQ